MKIGTITLNKIVYSLIVAVLSFGCASTPPPVVPPPTPPPAEAPVEKEPPLPFDVGRTRIPDYSQQPIDIEPHISSDPLPDQVYQPVTEFTSPEGKAPSDPTPDLGKKLPKLIYKEDLELYIAPSSMYRIYFDQGVWFVLSDDIWFRSKSHTGPWERIDKTDLPEALQQP